MRRAVWTTAVATLLIREHAVTEGFTGFSTKLGANGHHGLETFYLSRSTSPPAAIGAMATATTTATVGPRRTRRHRRSLLSKTDGAVDRDDLEESMQRLVRTLEQDLPLQYEKPQNLSIFGDDVEFQDPVTTLRGKLLYRGMLFFTLLFFRVACKPKSSYFNVNAIDRPSSQTIRTVWETGAVTRNGRELFISGVDCFTVGDDGRISRHDSAWDQTWEQVRDQVA